jgi:hypothetical protein
MSSWDVFIKISAIVGAIIVGFASFYAFFDQRRQEIVKSEIVYEEARSSAYTRAYRSTSIIGTATRLDGTQVQMAVDEFWRLYWKELVGQEEDEAEAAMIRFGRALQEWQQTGQKPEAIGSLSGKLANHWVDKLNEADKRKADLERNRVPLSELLLPESEELEQ